MSRRLSDHSNNSLQDNVIAFRDAMAADGIQFKGELIADGVLHRVRVDGDKSGSKAGFYVLHGDGTPAGAYGDFKRGIKTKWSAPKGASPLSREERAAMATKIKADRERRETEERRRWDEAAKRANKIWNAAKPAPNAHPYLARKGVISYGLRVGPWVKEFTDNNTGEIRTVTVPNALLVPIHESRDSIVSIQAIFSNAKNPLKRDKDFLKDAKKEGCYFKIGAPTEYEGRLTVLVAEGYATASTAHLCTGLCSVAAFDAGNLLPVAKWLREAMPDARIVVLADNDQWTKTPIDNPGVHYATLAAREVDGVLCVPEFTDLDQKDKPTDFNDLKAMKGGTEVVRQIRAAVTPEAALAHVVPAEKVEPESVAPAPPVVTVTKAKIEVVEEVDPLAGVDTGGHFKFLGYDHGVNYFYVTRTKQVTEIEGTSLTSKSVHFTMAPRLWWETTFHGKNDKYDSDGAGDWLLRTSALAGVYSRRRRVRGRGAWIDQGRIVYHMGDHVIVDGRPTALENLKTKFLYEMAEGFDPLGDTILTDEEGRWLYEVCKMFNWEDPTSAICLLGLIAIAPICGALDWRPHGWITGEASSGKTTVLNSFAFPLLNKMCVYAQGSSSEAGIRQELQKEALPVLYEESEANNDREMMKMENVLALVRQSSSESMARTFKGTTGGKSQDFHIRSIFLLCSIIVSIKQQADRERFIKMALVKRTGEASAERWRTLNGHLKRIKDDKTIGARLVLRMIRNAANVHRAIEMFRDVATHRMGSSRNGDMYGSVLAGLWSLLHIEPPSRPEAERMFDAHQWDANVEDSQIGAPKLLLNALLNSTIKTETYKEISVFELISAASRLPAESNTMNHRDANKHLKNNGMMVKIEPGQDCRSGVLLISNTSPRILDLLENTSAKSDWRNQLLNIAGAKRHVGADKKQKSEWFVTKDACIEIPLSLILDDAAPGAQDELPI